MATQEDIILKQALKFKGVIYERPAHVKIPTVWEEFEGKSPKADGTFPKYKIQDITEEWIDEILKYGKNIMQDIMGIKAYKQADGEVYARLLRALWSFVLKDRVGLMCLTDDGETPRLAGFQINEVSARLRTEDDCTSEGGDENVTKFLLTLMEVRRDVNVFEKYNVDAYIDAFGLFVKAEFRNQGIGYHLQHAKIPLCKALGIKLMANGFGSDIATHIAEKIGFKLLDKRLMSEVNGDFDEVQKDMPSTNQFVSFYAMNVE